MLFYYKEPALTLLHYHNDYSHDLIGLNISLHNLLLNDCDIMSNLPHHWLTQSIYSSSIIKSMVKITSEDLHQYKDPSHVIH